MAGETLYLKWRPRDFDEVVGQSHVTKTLRNACLSGRVAHAYLLAGPRGTGKTSVARILAKALNCLNPEVSKRPCNECHVCTAVNEGRFLDLIEIDGASNRGIDEIRDLREKVNFRPNEGRYKIYIIDEVHMLTREAFNALLKTLEEPPEYVVFVFATTEVWRVPATIRSRCQRFDFRPIRLELIESRLRQICEEEGIGRDDRVLPMIARQATGSLRDAIGMLDQISSIGEGMITAELVRSVLGTAPDDASEQLLGFILDGDLAPAVELVNQLAAEGFDMRQFARDVLRLVRAMMLLRLGVRPGGEWPDQTLARLDDMSQGMSAEVFVQLARTFSEAIDQSQSGFLPQLPLELAVVEACGSMRRSASRRSIGERIPETAEQQVRSLASSDAQAQGIATVSRSQPTGEKLGVRAVSMGGRPTGEQPLVTLERLRKLWPKVGVKVHKKDRTLEALLRSSEPIELQGDRLTVAFAYPFHCRCMEGQAERETLLEAVGEVAGCPLEVECVVVAPGSRPAARDPESREDAPNNSSTEEPDLEQDPLYKAAAEMGGRIQVVQSGGDEVE